MHSKGAAARRLAVSTLVAVLASACTAFNGLSLSDAASTEPLRDASASLDGDAHQAMPDALAHHDAGRDSGYDSGHDAGHDSGHDAPILQEASSLADATACDAPHEYRSAALGPHCYRFGTVPSPWTAAESDCTTWGGYLAVITSAAEESFVSQIVNAEITVDSGYSDEIWIGLERQGDAAVSKETGFGWVDGEPFDFENWGTADPRDQSDQRCVVGYNKVYGDTWSNFQCSVQTVYLCERN